MNSTPMSSAPQFSLLLSTQNRHDLLLRMLASVEAAAPGLPWEALVLCADQDDRNRDLPQRFPQVKLFDQAAGSPPGHPTWSAMMRFLLQRVRAPWFMYASDDIVFQAQSIVLALRALERFSGLAGGVAMAYRNVSADRPEWDEYGVDLTLGDQPLINYGFINTALAKSLGGFSDAYKLDYADRDLCLRVLQSGHRIIPCLEARVLHNNVQDRLKEGNSALADADSVVYRQLWTPRYYDVTAISRLLPDAPVADPLSPPGQLAPLTRHPAGVPMIESGQDALYALYQAGLYQPGRPLRLHLGCGENHLDGYVNIDHPPDQHAVMTPRADIFADIKTLRFPDNCLDEIRLHHVFEHFNRVEALGLLIRWHRWLRVGGVLHIETPDLAGSAKALLSDAPFKQKTAAVRHLAGDQTETWAYHVDHWFPERFHATFVHMGFGEPRLRVETWARPPHLANVTAIGAKSKDLPTTALLNAADELLWLSTVAPSEIPTYEVWKRQLRDFLHYRPVHPAPLASAVSSRCKDILPAPTDSPPLEAIHDFNQRERDRWMSAKAAATPAGAAVLDVGAGTCPYRPLFAHCRYTAHDFKAYEGVKLGGGREYGDIDLVGEITEIPAPDASFDAVICTEVLEHVPDPVGALKEMIRLLLPGGRLLLTAPLGSGLHQEPYHYYGGFTRHFYERFLPELGVEITELRPNGGFFRHLAQECARTSWTFEQHRAFHGDRAEAVRELFHEHLPRYLYAMDEQFMIEAFTVGYFVEGMKK